jgi:hypothetical protein
VKVILVVLALIWVVALTPTLLRKLAERESTYSVTKFHRSLRVMRQSYPGHDAGVIGLPGRLGYHGAPAAVPARGVGRPAGARISAGSARRRRQVLMVLGGGLAGTFLLGLVPGLSTLWVVSLLLLAVTAGYVGLLIHFRRAELERAQKVVHLSRSAAPAPAAAASPFEVTAEVPAVPPAVPPFAVPAGARISRVRPGGPVRILTDRREARTPAVVGG